MPSAREHLRTATSSLHYALEADAGAIDGLRSAANRAIYVRRYHQFYAGAESLLRGWLRRYGFPTTELRAVVETIEIDLRTLGATPPVPKGDETVLTSPAEALGFYYVVHGSTLGARVIRRTIAATESSLAGLAFLDPPSRSRDAWRSFLDLLEREVGSDLTRRAAATTGAVKGFTYARACLCGPTDE